MARLRIISGEFGGRWISADIGRATHPMGDRVRSALFNSLTSRYSLDGAVILDAFAGTGAIGLEALSRGAFHATFIERDRTACRVIQHNISLLGVDSRAKLIKTSVSSWQSVNNSSPMYDVIFTDPPYHSLQLNTVLALAGYLKNNGLMILSYPGRLPMPKPSFGVVVVDKLKHGEATLIVFQKTSINHSQPANYSR